MADIIVKTKEVSDKVKGLFDKPISEIKPIIDTLSDILDIEELNLVQEDLSNLVIHLMKLNAKLNSSSTTKVEKFKTVKISSKELKNKIYNIIQNNKTNREFLTTNKIVEENNEPYQRVKYCIDPLIEENRISCDMSGFQHKF